MHPVQSIGNLHNTSLSLNIAEVCNTRRDNKLVGDQALYSFEGYEGLHLLVKSSPVHWEARCHHLSVNGRIQMPSAL